VAERTSHLGEVHGAYVDARGWAQGASTLRLRWRLRRLPQHAADQQQAAEVKALRDELCDRGVVVSS
jgi:hypothetical protein